MFLFSIVYYQVDYLVSSHAVTNLEDPDIPNGDNTGVSASLPAYTCSEGSLLYGVDQGECILNH